MTQKMNMRVSQPQRRVDTRAMDATPRRDTYPRECDTITMSQTTTAKTAVISARAVTRRTGRASALKRSTTHRYVPTVVMRRVEWSIGIGLPTPDSSFVRVSFVHSYRLIRDEERDLLYLRGRVDVSRMNERKRKNELHR